MDKKAQDTLSQIEAAQAELRESIEIARELADKSDQLIKKHRKELKQGD